MHHSLTTTLLLLPLTTAHVKLIHPAPYGAPTLNTNPLLASGADYPCKLRPSAFSFPSNTNTTIIPIGTPQTLLFQGQATHGGGSCQISLTRDTPPTVDSVFRVIKSIEGGCPSSNPGNVGTDPEGYGADGMGFEIPSGVGRGEFTLAWSWFNRIGEREMYMNCAPVSVVGGGGGKKGRRRGKRGGDGLDSLPVMFRANIGNGCRTAESGTVLGFPEENLGGVVQRIGTEALVPPVGNCGGADGSGSTVGGSSAEPSVSSATPSVSSAAPPAYQAPPPALPTTQASSAPLPSVSPAPPASQSPPAAPSISPAAAPSTPAGTTTGTCPTPGKSVCSPDGKAWGTCMENLRVMYQPVAVGTKCDPALGVEVAA